MPGAFNRSLMFGNRLKISRHIHAARLDDWRKYEVLLDRQGCKYSALFGAVGDPEQRYVLGCFIYEFGTFESDRSLPVGNQPHDGFKRCSFTGAVASQQADDLAFIDYKIDPMQNVRLAVTGVKICDLQ